MRPHAALRLPRRGRAPRHALRGRRRSAAPAPSLCAGHFLNWDTNSVNAQHKRRRAPAAHGPPRTRVGRNHARCNGGRCSPETPTEAAVTGCVFNRHVPYHISSSAFLPAALKSAVRRPRCLRCSRRSAPRVTRRSYRRAAPTAEPPAASRAKPTHRFSPQPSPQQEPGGPATRAAHSVHGCGAHGRWPAAAVREALEGRCLPGTRCARHIPGTCLVPHHVTRCARHAD